MSFKHNNSNSSVAQALEKIALARGLIKPQEKAKQKELDLEITASLSENILKLCNGLKHYGLDSYAEDLENNFINFKVAEAKETGEDVINSAHPDGSHKLEGVAGDSLVETIIDKHLKMLEIANKEANGKLSSANQIISAVKNALGQHFIDTFKDPRSSADITETEENKKKIQSAQSKFDQAVKILSIDAKNIEYNYPNTVKEIIGSDKNLYDYIMGVQNSTVSANVLKNLNDNVRIFYHAINNNSEISAENKQKLQGHDSQVSALIKEAKDLIDSMYSFETPEEKLATLKAKIQTQSDRIDRNIQILNTYVKKLTSSKKYDAEDESSGVAWLEGQRVELETYQNALWDLPTAKDGKQSVNFSELLKKINLTITESSEFYKKWIAPLG